MRSILLGWLLVALTAPAFAGPGGGKGRPLDFAVDRKLAGEHALPGPDGAKRPLAAIAGERGLVARFVERELVLLTDDPAEAAATAARWRGEIVGRLEPARFQLPGLPQTWLLRVDPATGDARKLTGLLRRIDPHVRGRHRVSSASAVSLLAIAASEAVAGRAVGLNWVAEGAAFRDRTSMEAEAGPAGWSRNAFDWAYFRRGGALDVGVAEAWRALDLAGRLGGERFPIGIIDGGFRRTHPEYPADGALVSAIPFIGDAGDFANTMPCGGEACPWHGTAVTLAAMASADDGRGAAGTAGPVARPVLTATLGDMFTLIYALAANRIAGARIINMSLGAPVPGALAWSVSPFDVATNSVRAEGMLIFAAAGNDGDDVDASDCVGPICWEETWHYPCENTGVICVGATDFSRPSLAAYSNYPSRYDGDSVDLFGPGEVYVNMRRDADGLLQPPTPGGDPVELANGTSIASPFVAGVAALVWTANPTWRAEDVERALYRTARPGRGLVHRYVNAYDAVIMALGRVPEEPPTIRILAPTDGARIDLNVPTSGRAVADDAQPGCCTITWSSDLDGPLGAGAELTLRTPGRHVITATATDAAGLTASASVNVDVVNTAPTVRITHPFGFTVYAGEVVPLLASVSDPNQILPCDRITWYLRGEGPVAEGCEGEITFARTGHFVLEAVAADDQGFLGHDAVDVYVDDPEGPAIEARILEPSDGAELVDADTPVRLLGEAARLDGGPIRADWVVLWEDERLGLQRAFVATDTLDARFTPRHAGIDCNRPGLPITVELRVTPRDVPGARRIERRVEVALACVPQ